MGIFGATTIARAPTLVVPTTLPGVTVTWLPRWLVLIWASNDDSRTRRSSVVRSSGAEVFHSARVRVMVSSCDCFLEGGEFQFHSALRVSVKSSRSVGMTELSQARRAQSSLGRSPMKWLGPTDCSGSSIFWFARSRRSVSQSSDASCSSRNRRSMPSTGCWPGRSSRM
jgi:hypothetical protein